MRPLSKIAKEVAALVSGQPGVNYTFTTIGAGASGAINEGLVYAKLTPKSERQLTYDDLRNRIRAQLSSYGRAITSVEEVEELGDAKPIQISVRGADLATPDQLSARVAEVARRVPGAVDVDRSLDRDKPEVKVHIDRKLASDLGVNLDSVATTMRALLNGEVATQYEDPDGDAYDQRIPSKEKWLRVHNTQEWPDYYDPEYEEYLRRFFDRRTGHPGYWRRMGLLWASRRKISRKTIGFALRKETCWSSQRMGSTRRVILIVKALVFIAC